MKRTAFVLLAVSALFSATAPSKAVVLDLSTMTCQQFVDSDKDMISMMLTWLDGWYKGDSDDARINTDVFVENARQIGIYCRKNPTTSIVTAADEILGK